MKFQATLRFILAPMVLTSTMLACNPLNLAPAQGAASQPVERWPVSTALPSDASGIEGVKTFAGKPDDHKHVDNIKTPAGGIPPAFGEHYAAWQNCGIYDKPVGLGNALHSMEHGAVWLTYRPDLPAAEVTELQALVRGHGYVLLSPYEEQTVDVILTAWGVQLIIQTLPDDRITPFITYYEQGPQNPEPGAPCSGAVGEPLP